MRLLKELTIRGASPQLARLLETLERPLAGGWRRDAEAETRLSGLGLPGGGTHCFACTAEGRRPAAALWLESRGGEALHVANIVPLGKRELSDDEYNLILAEFHAQVLQPARDGLSIQAELTHNRVTPESYLSPEAVRRLKAFSALANRSSLRHEDCQRWREFTIQTHVEGADFDPSLLDRWLAEEGWPEDQRQHLVSEYESFQTILAAYDEERLEKMPSLADVVARLVAARKPVICLDTCDILEVVQCLDWERPSTARNTACVTAARRLLTTLAADPDKALVAITDLVVTEWNQNIAEIRDNAIRILSQVDGAVRRPYQAAVAAGISLPAYTDLSASALVDNLVALSKALLNQATRIDLDAAGIDLAVRRVLTRRRPSQDGHLKDSIHFEHYLELARRLRAAGFAEECAFVSKNRKDFWNGQQPTIHPDLAAETANPAVLIRFFGSIEAALGHLHL